MSVDPAGLAVTWLRSVAAGRLSDVWPLTADACRLQLTLAFAGDTERRRDLHRAATGQPAPDDADRLAAFVDCGYQVADEGPGHPLFAALAVHAGVATAGLADCELVDVHELDDDRHLVELVTDTGETQWVHVAHLGGRLRVEGLGESVLDAAEARQVGLEARQTLAVITGR